MHETGTGPLPASRSERVIQGQAPSTSARRVLLFSYAFPPIQMQMTSAVVKPMAALAHYGHEVDVLCAAAFLPYYARDASLVPYAERHFGNVTPMYPREDFFGRLRQRSKVLSLVPDPMIVLQRKAFDTLMNMDLDRYEAIITGHRFTRLTP